MCYDISKCKKVRLVTLNNLQHRKNHMSEPLSRLEKTVSTSWLEGTISVTVGCCLSPGTLRSRQQDRIRHARDILKSPWGKMGRELEEAGRADRPQCRVDPCKEERRSESIRLQCSGSPQAKVTIRGVTLLIKVGLPHPVIRWEQPAGSVTSMWTRCWIESWGSELITLPSA